MSVTRLPKHDIVGTISRCTSGPSLWWRRAAVQVESKVVDSGLWLTVHLLLGKNTLLGWRSCWTPHIGCWFSQRGLNSAYLRMRSYRGRIRLLRCETKFL